MSTAPTIHAGAIRLGADGVLIRGASGSGKSSLLLHLLIRHPDTARLISDDRVILTAKDGRLVASAPPEIAGKLEIRGQGIVEIAYVSPAAIRLVVDLLPAAECPRLPEKQDRTTSIDGVTLPRLKLPIGIGDGADRVQAALAWGMKWPETGE